MVTPCNQLPGLTRHIPARPEHRGRCAAVIHRDTAYPQITVCVACARSGSESLIPVRAGWTGGSDVEIGKVEAGKVEAGDAEAGDAEAGDVETGTPQQNERPQTELGRRGEDIAAEYLTGLGLVVLARNWRCRGGELDLVATDCKRLVVCEVKTRSGTGYGDPAEGVTPAKAARIRRATASWLRTYRVGCCEVRFDVIAVLCPPGRPVRVTHLEGAF